MPLTCELVDGVAAAAIASEILRDAWTLPAISYSADYMAWQLGFPGPLPLRAAVAFEGSEPVGFAGASWRRMRCGDAVCHVALVSFVGVRRNYRARGIGARLYRRLLGFLRETGTPIITFAITGSAGETLLLREYAEGGFTIRSVGSYPGYHCLARTGMPAEGVTFAARPDDTEKVLSEVVSLCAADTEILWSDPGPDQIRHYLSDPRPRVLLVSRSAANGAPQAAWSVRLDIRSAGGDGTVTAVDSVWLPRTDDPAALRSFVWKASEWDTGSGPVVSLPSLYGYEAGDLRQLGIRQTGMPFRGYYCEPQASCLPDTFRGTSLEIA